MMKLPSVPENALLPNCRFSRSTTCISVLFISALSLLLCACSGSGGSDTPGALPQPVAERFVIDGVVDLATVGTVQEKTLNILDTFGTGAIVKSATLRYAARNDDRNLYIALEWDDATQDSFEPGVMDNFDGIVISFDNNGNGVLDENEDAHRLVMTNYGSIYGDLHVHLTEAIDDTVADGRGRMSYSAGKYHAEFLIPLAPDAAGEDGTLNATTRFNVLLYDHIQILIPAGNIGYLNGGPQLGAGTVTTAWAFLPYVTPGTYDQPAMPSGLTGLIAFISDHENSKGEIYTFNPATNNVVRVTNNTGLYLDGVSLSHDRTRIAYFGAPTSTDYTNYDIYTVNVDGTNLLQLTNNNPILDGHPAWSPNDTEIVYASFRAAGKASLIRMNATTHAEIQNLTPVGANDNDPDWLPDGRIVFKTDRFGTPGTPEVRIAVMNADGSNVQQVTNTASTSDHDPVATNTVAVFERFTKGTDYATDPAALYAAWNIVEARIDGSSERNLIADGWINWLPVYDPSAQYLVYLKSVGYTDARLMNKDGRDLGRLIPNISRVRYIDWK